MSGRPVRNAGITLRGPDGATAILGWNGIDEIVAALEARDTEESKNLLRWLREGNYTLHDQARQRYVDDQQLRGVTTP